MAMTVSQVWRGKSSLPSYEDMTLWHSQWIQWRRELVKKQKIPATFYVVQVNPADHLIWLDDMAGTNVFEHFGWFSLKAWSFWWNDRKLYNACANGLFTPTIWRLFETGKRRAWPKAREQIFLDNEAAQAQVRARSEKLKLAESKKTL